PRFQGTSDCGRYGDFVHELDWMVGEVMDTLESEGLKENTLVIFTSDNGGMFNVGGQDSWKAGHRMNGDLLGFKFGAWEGGHRVPFIARWPGKIEAGTVSNQLVSNVDLLGTMAALTGQELTKKEGADSFNILPALTGNPREQIRDHLVISAFKKDNITLRKGKWVYIDAQGSGGFGGKLETDYERGGPGALLLTHHVNSDIENGKLKPNAPPAQLYNLDDDLIQTTNRYNQRPEVVAEMQGMLKQYIEAEYTAPDRQ
ncbi:MAG: sulfatase-like hydrolase/transferase, partial [Verrucomicrobiae bacterium]|nr:sulfatase-like hydrolase/transferase [Verrucomicrobiae bacterium]